MRPSTPLEFPGSRHVAGWWKQLAPVRPRALWVAHLHVHDVEALVEVSRLVHLEPLTGLLLQALGLGDTTAGLEKQLGVTRQLVWRMLVQLQADGLATSGADGCWQLTTVGREALAQGTYSRPTQERRSFGFLENEAGRAPHFLHLAQTACTPYPADESRPFDVGLLRDCVCQSVEWKERHHFAQDIDRVVEGEDLPASVPAWQAVILDRPGSLAGVLVAAPGEHGERLCGYAVEVEGWMLEAREAAFQVQTGWQEVFPDLATDPSLEQWREAWRGWCQRRGVPTVEAAECGLDRQDLRVRVRAPGRLLERLRSARSEALKGEAWLLAGTGRVRTAALIELQTER